jgi:hypothetical protein
MRERLLVGIGLVLSTKPALPLATAVGSPEINLILRMKSQPL